MTNQELIDEIKVDLGSDVNSLGISDETISVKIKEALRKISSYAPFVRSGYFPVVNERVEMPENTVCVTQVLNQTNIRAGSNDYSTLYQNDTDLFSVSRYLFNYNDRSDPFIFLMQKNQLNTLQNFVTLSDWRYDDTQNILYVNNFGGTTVSLIYLTSFSDISEVKDTDMQQAIKEYTLALCKIIEGQIRRKLQDAPGAVKLDGDSLVSEGVSERDKLDELLPKRFMNLRFGIRI